MADERTATSLTRRNLGFLLAKASQRWNELLHAGFSERGFAEVRPAYGSILIPLFEEDGLRMGQLAARARLSKQTMTTLFRVMEREGLVRRERDPHDRRAYRVFLSQRARDFEPVAEQVLLELESLVSERLTRTQARALRAALTEVIEL